MKEFDTFQEAFDYCREAGRPITVLVDGEKWKLYPSGRAERRHADVPAQGERRMST